MDGIKYAGGSFALMPADVVRSINKVAHDHDAYVSAGGWIENVLRFGPAAVESYIEEAKALGFDVIEISTGFISLPADALLRLVQKVKNAGLKAKPELGIQFGAGGSTSAEELEAEGTKDVGWLIAQAERALDAGAEIIMIESEGISENVKAWRTDVVARIINQLGLDKVMFEGADPEVFEWYVKNYGNEVNLFVDHSQIVQVEALRSGIWGTKSTWGPHSKPRQLKRNRHGRPRDYGLHLVASRPEVAFEDAIWQSTSSHLSGPGMSIRHVETTEEKKCLKHTTSFFKCRTSFFARTIEAGTHNFRGLCLACLA